MIVTLGTEGLDRTWGEEFEETVECCRCKGVARIAFVAHEGIEADPLMKQFCCSLHPNEGEGGFWPRDCIAVAVYFCRECLEPTACYNQA